MTSLHKVKESRTFSGQHITYEHDSQATGCKMRFSVFMPEEASNGPVPVVYFLSGLTCTDENFSNKSGAQRYAAEHGVALVMPDTSPRGVDIPGQDESSDFGSGAGFYLNATEAPWAAHYQMDSYVTRELPELLVSTLPLDHLRAGVFGHSMGGHGALTLGLKHPSLFRSISAFSPICAPMRCDWGKKALSGYLGSNREAWEAHDATCLIKKLRPTTPLLVDQGLNDEFLEQLQPDLLEAACKESGTPLTLRRHPGYDHSYYFIASFVGEHIAWHAEQLKATD